MADGRTNNGGARVGAGRVSVEVRERFQLALAKVMTDDALESMINGLVRQSEKGDVRAAQLLFSYYVGPPPQETQKDEGKGGPPVINLIFEEAKPKKNDGEKAEVGEE